MGELTVIFNSAFEGKADPIVSSDDNLPQSLGIKGWRMVMCDDEFRNPLRNCLRWMIFDSNT